MKGRILLIDDSPLDLKIASSVLEREGYACFCFTDYKEAATWMDENTPQIIFLDLQMPGITGYDLIPVFKKHRLAKNSPIIIMSGKNQAEDVKKAIIAGASDYLVKPIDPLVLQEKMKKTSNAASTDEFASVSIPDGMFDGTHIVQNMKILELSEFGCRVTTNRAVAAGENIDLSGLSLEKFGSKTLLARCLHCTQDAGTKEFVIQFTFVGMTESQRQKIRKLCRQIWIQSKEKAA